MVGVGAAAVAEMAAAEVVAVAELEAKADEDNVLVCRSEESDKEESPLEREGGGFGTKDDMSLVLLSIHSVIVPSSLGSSNKHVATIKIN